jgi:hypothetical protein
MYNITKFVYNDFTIYSISRIDENVMSFAELYKVKQQLTKEWCCQYFPAKKDFVNNANEYHLFSCKEPDLHLCKGFDESEPIEIIKLIIDGVQ